MHRYFNPKRFLAIADAALPLLAVITTGLLGYGLYQALIISPADYQQGDYVRIMYVHVPTAWMALAVFCFMAGCGAASLIWKNPLSDILGISAAPIGASFALICLVTGSIWGKPSWGTWWVWDARLTSMLILFFLYLSYLGLYHAFENKEHAGKVTALLSLVGLINIPIIKFSVQWWNTLHQPASILRAGGVAIAPAMLTPLLLMFGATIGIFLCILLLRVKNILLIRKIERLENLRLR